MGSTAPDFLCNISRADKHVDHELRLFFGRARTPPKEQGVEIGEIFTLHKKLGKGGMALIGSGLKACIRAVDHLFRLRRDEFCILLPETDATGAGYVLRRLQGQSESGELWGEDIEPRPDVQIASTSTPETGVKSGDDLLKRTRHALAKRD